MSPRMWLWSVVFAIAGCENDAEDEHITLDRPQLDAHVDDSDNESTQAGSYGPENSWWNTAAIPEGLSGTGFSAGDTAYDFTLVDQHGDPVQLYQFYGQVIVLELFVEWCVSCQDLAHVGQRLWEDLADEDFVYLSVMIEDVAGNTPAAEDAADWAARFDLTHPVLADTIGDQAAYVEIAYPTIVVIDRDMTIAVEDFWPMDPMWIEEFVAAP